MPAITKLLITSIGCSGAVFMLSMIARVAMQAIRGGGKLETDFVVPQELSLLALSVTFACLIGYMQFPRQICPIAETVTEGIVMFSGLLLVETVLFFVSVVIGGKVARKQRLGKYGSPGRLLIAFGIFYRNLSGLLSVVLVAVLLMIGRF